MTKPRVRASQACLALALTVAGLACEPTTCQGACAEERDDCLDEAESYDDETECARVYEECYSVCEGRDN